MIDFELSEGIQTQRQMVHAVAEQAMRPIAREYDEREHEKPWDFLNMMWQVSSGNPVSTGGEKKPKEERAERNLSICVSIEEQMERLRSARSSFGFFSPPVETGFPLDTCHIMLRKSHGFSCSRSSYSRAIGRIACSAAACTICRCIWMPSDSSKSIIGAPPHTTARPSKLANPRALRSQSSTGCSRMYPWPPRTCTALSVMFRADWLAYCFTRTASRVAGRPESSFQAASQVRSRIESISIAMSASLKATACFWAMATPKARRSL